MSAHEIARDVGLPRRDGRGESQLDDYETEHCTVVVYDTARPLGWIEVDPDALVEVRRL
jgi:hypothetical protein